MSLSNKVDDPVVVSVTVPASSTLRVSATVTGGSLTGFIVIVIVTVFPSTVPSFTLYENVSDVVFDPSWTYVNVPSGFKVKVP